MRVRLPIGAIDLTDPEFALLWDPPAGGGIYMMLRRAKRSYEVLYVGETHNFAGRGIGPGHHAWDRCVEHAGGEIRIHVTTFTMPRASAEVRRAVECALIEFFDPPCNQSTIACPIPRR